MTAARRLGLAIDPKPKHSKAMHRDLPQYVFATATDDWLIYRRHGSK